MEETAVTTGGGGSQPSDPIYAGEKARVSDIIFSSSCAKYKSMSPARLPIVARTQQQHQQHCLTIPPGLSPTTLLESPVLLTNVKVEPSPTTGTFAIPSIVDFNGYDCVASPIGSSNNSSCEEGFSNDFEFKPRSRFCFGTNQPSGTLLPTESEAGVANNCHSEISTASCIKPANGSTLSHATILPARDNSIAMASSEVVQGKMQCLNDMADGTQESQIDNRGSDLLNSLEKTSDDGYNWRKYGQKHVKGSEFPRSYYKCTHPNCQVKKQLERSHDGQITDIIYKGKHDHPKPQLSRRSALGAVISLQEERIDALTSAINGEDRSSKIDDQKCYLVDAKGVTELSPLSEGGGSVALTEISNNKHDDIGDDDADPEAKRRKENSMDISAMSKITREPRVVIQTLSEVDILDDGYRWRKYGQKVVKGNPNPRSYYKCTNVGCPVRKHVERASHDPKAVITTYEGKHNHDVPSARTSSHDNAASIAISSGGAFYNCMPMPMTCEGMQTAPHNFNPCDDSDSISLDLGVGLSPRQKDGNYHLQQSQSVECARISEIDSTSSGSCKLVIPSISSTSYYGVSNNGTNYFGSTENAGESFSFTAASVGHPSEPYLVNRGNVLTGP